MWIDRVYASTRELQRSRLGGVAHARNATFPGNPISWTFKNPATSMSVAILVNFATQSELKLEVYNLEKFDVEAEMTGWDIFPGIWEITQGIDEDGDGKPDSELIADKGEFERSLSVPFRFKSGKSTLITLRLVKKGLDYDKRSDLAIGEDDIIITGGKVIVKVHNLGAVKSAESSIILKSSDGKIIGEARIPELNAPNDLYPKTVNVELHIAAGIKTNNLVVQIDPEGKLPEITKMNNAVKISNGQ